MLLITKTKNHYSYPILDNAMRQCVRAYVANLVTLTIGHSFHFQNSGGK